MPQISTGDMFREMKSADTPLAREIQAIMASGKLISDDLTFEVVKDRTSRADCSGSFILDGYPRTAVQAEQLESLAGELGKQITAVEVSVPREELRKRLTGRRSCPECGEIYNIYSKPPVTEGFCDMHPATALNHRADDNDESVTARLATYDAQTKPLIDYYSGSDRLVRIEAVGDVEEIYTKLVSKLG